MLGSLAWLALEVENRPAVTAFYRDRLGLSVLADTGTSTELAAGAARLLLRDPGQLPRGGLHTHYAFSVPAGEYEQWYGRLDAAFDLEEMDFGGAKSLYLDDPAGNCVELGQRDVEGPGIDGVFEVVLEVVALERARSFYTAMGFEVVDTGASRRRVRLTTGELDLELWEPQRGIAGGRGGVHVDWGLGVDDPEAAAESVEAESVEHVEDGVRLRDPDGHVLTLVGTE